MTNTPIGPLLRKRWGQLSRLPAGKWLFSKVIGLMVPYTGSLKAIVQHLSPGHVIVELKERRAIRNHLKSVHAIALANLLEQATGLAVLSAMPDDYRGILTSIKIEYLKKSRGVLTAECKCMIPEINEQQEHLISGKITDADGDVVARGVAHWLIGPEKNRS